MTRIFNAQRARFQCSSNGNNETELLLVTLSNRKKSIILFFQSQLHCVNRQRVLFVTEIGGSGKRCRF